ncbi:MAG: energy transducer TonB [Pyrinomonadaceae bacterium]
MILAFISALCLARGSQTSATNYLLQDPEQPAVISSPAPEYPPIAFAARASGSARVEVEIDETGAVSAARMTSGHPLLRRASEEAARRWRFAPSPAGTGLRRATLVFDFMPPDEVACEGHADEPPAQYVSPTHVEIRYLYHPHPAADTVERLPGNLPRKYCRVHGELLRKDEVEIRYGLLGFAPGYEKAEEKLFPNANFFVGGGCVIETEVDPCTGEERQSSPQRAEVLYCPKCRLAESLWHRKHPLKPWKSG